MSKKYCCCEQKCGEKLTNNKLKITHVEDTITAIDFSFSKTKKSTKNKPKNSRKK